MLYDWSLIDAWSATRCDNIAGLQCFSLRELKMASNWTLYSKMTVKLSGYSRLMYNQTRMTAAFRRRTLQSNRHLTSTFLTLPSHILSRFSQNSFFALVRTTTDSLFQSTELCVLRTTTNWPLTIILRHRVLSLFVLDIAHYNQRKIARSSRLTDLGQVDGLHSRYYADASASQPSLRRGHGREFWDSRKCWYTRSTLVSVNYAPHPRSHTLHDKPLRFLLLLQASTLTLLRYGHRLAQFDAAQLDGKWPWESLHCNC